MLLECALNFFGGRKDRLIRWCFRARSFSDKPDMLGMRVKSEPSELDEIPTYVEPGPLTMSLADSKAQAGVWLGELEKMYTRCQWSIITLRESAERNEKLLAAQFLAINLCASNRWPLEYTKLVCLNWGGEPSIKPRFLIEICGMHRDTESTWRGEIKEKLDTMYDRAMDRHEKTA